jgi:4-hydroxybenzoate polyprenyltransferase
MKYFKGINQYLSLVTFSHTIFALPFALIGFFLAVRYHSYPFSTVTLIIVILCMVFARNAAMGLNRYADRLIDAKNPRTAKREIPSGNIKARSALIFTLVNSLLFIVAAGFLNPLCLYLSPVALLVILGYSYTKRFTAWCHLILGLGLAIAPLGAYLAVSGKFHWLPLFLSAIVLSWVSGFDIIYALQDEKFDKEERLFSIPARLGTKRALWVSTGFHITTAIIVVAYGLLGYFGLTYWVGSIIFMGLLMYQHVIVKPNDFSRINRAFGTTNGIASVIYAIFFISALYFL